METGTVFAAHRIFILKISKSCHKNGSTGFKKVSRLEGEQTRETHRSSSGDRQESWAQNKGWRGRIQQAYGQQKMLSSWNSGFQRALPEFWAKSDNLRCEPTRSHVNTNCYLQSLKYYRLLNINQIWNAAPSFQFKWLLYVNKSEYFKWLSLHIYSVVPQHFFHKESKYCMSWTSHL